jgi:uncharacterized membrane protein
MPTLEAFLTKPEEDAVVEAIRQAEASTSGEIRVHIEEACFKDIYEHALEVFHWLKMDNTKLQNGVLIYVAVNNKSFVICGDKGINAIVGEVFWNSTRDKIQTQFKQGHFKQGLIDGILEAGKVLSKHFPWEHGDVNELDNSISKGSK